MRNPAASNGRLKVVCGGTFPAPVNMAIDEVLADGITDAGFEVFVRMYQWAPPAFSFGYFQKPEALLDLEELKKSGLGAVRRRSGGKMVFHADEWTFSMGASLDLLTAKYPGRTTFLEFFQTLLTPLVNALTDLGLPVHFAREAGAGGGQTAQALCYAAAAGHSLYLGDRKLVGAAGIQQRGVLCIHGSLPIAPTEFPRRLFRREIGYEKLLIAWLSECLPPAAIRRFPQDLAEAFQREFPGYTVISGLTTEERESAEHLAARKYARLNWPNSVADPNR